MNMKVRVLCAAFPHAGVLRADDEEVCYRSDLGSLLRQMIKWFCGACKGGKDSQKMHTAINNH